MKKIRFDLHIPNVRTRYAQARITDPINAKSVVDNSPYALDLGGGWKITIMAYEIDDEEEYRKLAHREFHNYNFLIDTILHKHNLKEFNYDYKHETHAEGPETEGMV